MDPSLYQRLVDLLDLLVSRLETDNIDYEPMLASFANNTEQHIMSLEDTNSISTSEAPPRDLSPESDMHTITRFKGKFGIPEISRTERFENKLESKDQSFLPLALPIIPILFPFIPPIFFPESRRIRPKPKTNVRHVVEPDVVIETVEIPEYTFDPWAVPVATLVGQLARIKLRVRELSNRYPEIIPGDIIKGTAAIGAIILLLRLWPPTGAISKIATATGALIAALTPAMAASMDNESSEARQNRKNAYREYVDIVDQYNELDSIIKWRESNEGKTEGLGDLAGGFALDKHRDTLREIEATTQYTLPPRSQEAIDNEYYDRGDWFYDFKNGWPTIRDIMFIGKQIDPSKAPEDLRKDAAIFSDTTTTFYKIVPSAVYKRLEEETIDGNPNSARKLSKILAAKKYFSDDRYRFRESGTFRADKIPRDLLIRREYYSIGRHSDESYVLTTGDDLVQPEIDIDNLQPRDHKEITRHLSEIVKIEPPIISPTSPQQQQSYEEVNKLLEEYILLSKKNKSTKDTLIQDIKSISNQ